MNTPSCLSGRTATTETYPLPLLHARPICRGTRCSKQPPLVRDAFSEAFGVKNRLFRYGRDIRCQKQPSLVRDASSKARRTADSTGRGQLPGVRDAFSEAYRAKSSTCRTGRIFSARNAHRSEVSKYKRRRLISDYWSLSSWMDSTPRRGCSPLRSQKSRRFCRIAKSPTSFDPASITPG